MAETTRAETVSLCETAGLVSGPDTPHNGMCTGRVGIWQKKKKQFLPTIKVIPVQLGNLGVQHVSE